MLDQEANVMNTAEALVVDSHQNEAGQTRHQLIALSAPPEPYWAPVVIRLATETDRGALRRLAQLDSANEPTGDVILGETMGRAVAAISLTEGTVIADPFVPTGEVVDLLHLRAHQLAPKAPGGVRKWYAGRR